MKDRFSFRWLSESKVLSQQNPNLVVVIKNGKVVYDRKRDGILQRNGELYNKKVIK